jgi:hypothetical protein
MFDIKRRQFLQTLVAGTAAYAAGPAWAQDNETVGVVYLSRSGNTRVFAEALARRYGAALHEIRPRDPWPADYGEMVDWATDWRERSELLPLATNPDLSAHTTLFVCTPVWGGALHAPMRSALEGKDFSGNQILPLVTHGGFGPGNTLETLRDLASNARFAEPMVIECDQERRQMNELDTWLQTARDGI